MEIIELQIERLGINGEGVGKYEGMTVFVDGALPGEQIKAQTTQQRKNYKKASLLEILKSSSQRIDPICPLFGRCGGCQLMHLEYGAQLEAKRQRVADAILRIGKLNAQVEPCRPSPLPLHYRNKIQLPIAHGRPGLYARGSHTVIPIDKCHIHCHLGEKAFSFLKERLLSLPDPTILKHVLIKTAVCTKEILIVLVADSENPALQTLADRLLSDMPEIKGVVLNINQSEGNAVLGPQYLLLSGQDHITETLGGLTFSISPASFFQVNTPQAEALYTFALNCCRLTGQETVLDAFCGVGTLSLLAAKKAKKVIGIECVGAAIKNARANALQNNIANAAFQLGLTERLISSIENFDVALINPPRKGCEKLFIEKLLEKKPKRIVYISCDPATLARDLGLLAAKYQIETITPYDMFAQTAHVETVVSLRLFGYNSA